MNQSYSAHLMALLCLFEWAQLTFTCLKSTMETLEKGMKYFKLTIKTPERRQWRPSGVFIVNFEHILHVFLKFLLLTLNK